MNIKQDWILQYLGIPKWIIKNKKKIKNIYFLDINKSYLLIISDLKLKINNQLICDVAHSMFLKKEQIFIINPNEITKLKIGTNFYCWWLGINAFINFNCFSFYTPPLSKLHKNIFEKRKLWNLINNNINNYIFNKNKKTK